MNKETEGTTDSDTTTDLGRRVGLLEDEICDLKRSLLVGFDVLQQFHMHGTTLVEQADLMGTSQNVRSNEQNHRRCLATTGPTARSCTDVFRQVGARQVQWVDLMQHPLSGSR